MFKGYRLFSVLLVGVMMLTALAGCAPTTTTAPTAVPAAAEPTAVPAAAEPTAAPAVSEKPITLSIWTGFPELEPFYKAAAEDYKKLHPNVSVEILSTTLREAEQKLSASLPSNTGPDIADFGPNMSSKFVESGLLTPNPDNVNAVIKAAGVYDPFAIEYLTFDGKTYGIPFIDGSNAALYYNKTMFKEAGLDPEKPPSTMDEMMEAAKKLVQYDAAGNITRSGMSLRLSGQGSGIAEKFWFILYAMGGDPVVQTADGKWKNGYDNEAGRAAMKYYIDAVYKYHVDDQKVTHDSDAFVGETTAMLLRESWVIGEVKSKNPDMEYGIAPMPAGVRWGTLTQPWGVYALKAETADVAWDFCLFMTSKENAPRLTTMSGWLSPRMDADWAAFVKETPQYAVYVTPPADLAHYAYPLIGPFDELLTKMADKLVAAYLDSSLLDNPAGIEKTVHEMAVETDDILKSYELLGTE